MQLVGRQLDAGFEEQQWLVQRDGRFIQVSDLLYRILERLDGRRDLGAIAAEVSKTVPWSVSREQVRQLIEAKLVPAGLVTAQDGPPSVSPVRSPSPLGVNVRRPIVGPNILERVTRVLQRLFAPPVLAFVLTAMLAAHLWLYLDHGIGTAIREVTLQPFLIVAATLIFIGSAAIHELGHASALRYGGGRARGLGVGVYLVYPVFFTDTTDAYRLGRWERVRVDLGGFYFQLIVAVALMGLATLTGHEWLLFPAFLIDIEALRQLLFPFVRLDGYWLFADLSGVPDFFSHAIPFVRSLLPGAVRKGPALPALRRSTKIVFFAYLVVTVPVLGFLFFQLVTRAPGFAATAWHSFVSQKAVFAHAVAAGDVVQAAQSLMQIVILALPALGTMVLSVVLTGWLASILWRRHATRRAGSRLSGNISRHELPARR